MSLGTHGVKVKTSDCKRARWLTPNGGLTTKRVHAGTSSLEAAEAVASRLPVDNPGVVEWARAESFWKEARS